MGTALLSPAANERAIRKMASRRHWYASIVAETNSPTDLSMER